MLRQLVATIKQLDKALDKALTQHPKTELLESLPQVGRVNLGQIIGEVGPILDSAIDIDHVCAQAGATPVTRESGKQRHVVFRWTANTKARKSLITFADNSRHESDWATERYNAARRRNKRHPHALRILTRSWLRVIWAC